MAKGAKHPSPLPPDMGFDEALERFARTKPSEVEAAIKRDKEAKGSKRERPTEGRSSKNTPSKNC
jgi:hypothetical protein